MIDIALLRSDPGLVRRTVAQRGADVDVDRLVEIEAQLREANARVTRLRGLQRRSPTNRTPAGPAGTPGDPAGTPGGARDELRAAGDEVRALQELHDELWARVPNLLAPDTPAGADAGSNVLLRRDGDPVAADAGRRHDMAGTAARLAQAAFTHAQNVLRGRGFTPEPSPPPRPEDLLARYGDRILDGAGLPMRVSAWCPDPAPAVEQLVLCRPEDSAARLEECQHNVEEILRDLELPYRVLRACAGVLEAAEHKAYHTEVWFPGSGAYRRTHSAADHTDYQARRRRIRFLDRGRVAQPHTVRATGITDRTVLAVLENHVQPDGSVRVPAALRPYLDGRALIGPDPG